MKVVNLEAEINRTCQAVCGCDRKDCKWTHFGPKYRPEEACTVIQRLEEAQPEDAISVAWLRDLAEHISNRVVDDVVDLIYGLIEQYQREQEAQE